MCGLTVFEKRTIVRKKKKSSIEVTLTACGNSPAILDGCIMLRAHVTDQQWKNMNSMSL